MVSSQQATGAHSDGPGVVEDRQTEDIPEGQPPTSPAPDAADTPPGPDELPLVGSTLDFLRDPVAFYEGLHDAYDGDVVTYTIAGDRGYLLTDPADIERVLVTEAADVRKGTVIEENLGRLVANGLVVTEGEQWQADRTLLQPMFYRERIEGYADTMTAYSARVAEGWTPGEPVVVDEALRTLTLEVLAKTLLDIDVGDRRERIAADTDAMFARFEPSLSALLPLWVPTPRNRRAKRGLADFYDLVDELIAERRAAYHLEDGGDRGDGGDTTALDERDDLLSLMLTATYDDGTRMDEETVRDQLVTFLVAGHETTSLALTYALFLLAIHPEKQAKLHAELDEVLGGTDPTAADLFELDYLDSVVNEALRLYPPAFTIFRQTNEPKTFQGYEVPEDAILSMPQWVVHRDSRWYDDPDSFRPERWTDAFEAQLPEFAYYPFGGGPRSCIGNRFATMEAKLALATLCRCFRFEPVTEELDLTVTITLQPSDGVALRPIER